MRIIACSWGLLAFPAALAAQAEQTLPAGVAEAFDCYTALPGQLVPVLRKAQDEASADTTAAELHQALVLIYEAREKLNKLPALTSAQNQQVRLQYGQKMRQEWAALYAEIVRIRDARCFQSVPLAQEFRLMCRMIEK
ncbi:MAG: hypothetical protein IKY92_01700 [Akkermansia sp.]|nr:hypothetical protein [Akkermansia sp.]